MAYTRPATTLTPALIIYLIDASHSMNDPCGSTTKIAVVNQGLKEAIKDMICRSMRGGIVQNRYKVAILAYSTTVVDVLNGICDLPDLAKLGVPTISAGSETNTEVGFSAVEKLLSAHLAEFQTSPAPLVCHLTDALMTLGDPTPIIRRIQAMQVQDGSVLVEHVYVADQMLKKPVQDWEQWEGVTKARQLTNKYARLLFRLASPLPESYRQNINSYGYHLQQNAALFFPGLHMELVRLAFAISSATRLI